MKPLVVLVATFAIVLLTIKLSRNELALVFSARVAMSVMLIFTAIGHFVFTAGMAMMVPDFIPFKRELIYFTGIIEMLAAIGLFIPKLRVLIAWLLIVFFLLLLPANIKAAIDSIDIQKADYNGNGLKYLWFRIPLQVLFIVWTYLSAIRFNH